MHSCELKSSFKEESLVTVGNRQECNFQLHGLI